MPSVITRLINVGTGSRDQFDDRRIVIINITTLLAIGSQLVFSFVFYLNHFQAPAIFNLICLIGYCGVIALNYQKKTRLSALLLILVSTTQLFSLPVLFLGRETGIHYYSFAIISITFLIAWKNDRLPMIFGVLIFAGGGFMFAEYGAWQSPFVAPPPPQLATLFHFMATTGTITMITVVILTFYLMLDKAQELLRIEHQRAEHLLLSILPPSIAQRLKETDAIIADDFENVTILFADIVGFTEFSENLSPKSTVEILNRVFSLFDSLVDKYRLEKIKTIGDAYMVAGGLPSPGENDLEAIADLSLDMIRALAQFNIENNQTFEIRIGIHTGAVVAGVIGVKKFTYDVWGDTVNIAHRMESHGLPGQIQVSAPTYELLRHMYVFAARGIINVKGKGDMNTYLLQSKIG
jgi:class 3 adenylate cyclase